jgi:hypothetical protein
MHPKGRRHCHARPCTFSAREGPSLGQRVVGQSHEACFLSSLQSAPITAKHFQNVLDHMNSGTEPSVCTTVNELKASESRTSYSSHRHARSAFIHRLILPGKWGSARRRKRHLLPIWHSNMNSCKTCNGRIANCQPPHKMGIRIALESQFTLVPSDHPRSSTTVATA